MELSQYLSFPNPKTQKTNAEVTYVPIWLNRFALLIEVKAKIKCSSSIRSWLRNRLKGALEQITKNYNRIEAHEKIKFHNKYFHTFLDIKGLGLIILVYDENCDIKPSAVVPDSYQRKIPIYVFSWNNLKGMTDEIDTIPDLVYLNDRFDYLKISDISLGAFTIDYCQLELREKYFISPLLFLIFFLYNLLEVYRSKYDFYGWKSDCHFHGCAHDSTISYV